MNVIIFGASGFIGSEISNHLKSKKINIIKVSNKKRKSFFIVKDLKKKKFKKIDIVIHCASYGLEKFLSSKKLYLKNILISKFIGEFVVLNKIKNMIYLSSNSIYGKIDTKILNEKSLPNPIDAYGKSKLDSEKIFSNLYKKKYLENLLILRLPGVIGKKSKHNTISDISKKLKKQKKIFIYNGNYRFNSVIHVLNLVKFLSKIIYKKFGFKTINLASSKPIFFIDIVRKLINKINKNCLLENKNIKPIHLISLKEAKNFGYIPLSVSQTIKKYLN
jgi:nucleoside-diphosphate-sugar epimerase